MFKQRKQLLTLVLVLFAGTGATHPDLSLSLPTYSSQVTTSPSVIIASDLPKRIYLNNEHSLPIESRQLINEQWQISSLAITHLASSANPGQPGNMILYGHNTTQAFGQLKNIKPGQILQIQTEQDIVYTYQVQTTIVVPKEEIAWLADTSTPTLTMYTCDGFFDEKRVVVRAELVQ